MLPRRLDVGGTLAIACCVLAPDRAGAFFSQITGFIATSSAAHSSLSSSSATTTAAFASRANININSISISIRRGTGGVGSERATEMTRMAAAVVGAGRIGSALHVSGELGNERQMFDPVEPARLWRSTVFCVIPDLCSCFLGMNHIQQ